MIAEKNLVGTILWWTPLATFLNLVFINLARMHKSAPLFFILVALGGSLALFAPILSSLMLLGQTTTALLVFWLLLGLSIVTLVYANGNRFNSDFFRKNIEKRNSRIIWDANFDLNADSNKKYSSLNNLLRVLLLPFAPALGMAISRHFEGEQEANIMVFLLLMLALSFVAGYIRHLILGLKLLRWQRHNGLKIEIDEF